MLETISSTETDLYVGRGIAATTNVNCYVCSESETPKRKGILAFLRDELGIGSVHGNAILAGFLTGLIPHVCCRRLKAAIYRTAGFSIGAHSLLYGRLFLTGDENIYKNLRIGEYCRINTPCRIGLTASVVLEDRVVLGHGVVIVTECHDMNHPLCRAGVLSGKPVTIGRGAWIGANATILPGVTIGAGAVIGAGSVVTHDVPPNTLAAGDPAHPIRSLPTEI